MTVTADRAKANGQTDPRVLLEVEDLVVNFPLGKGRVAHAVAGVTLTVYRGETLGLVGESGCGKSTVGKAIVQLQKSTSGKIRYAGVDLAQLTGEQLREIRSRLQMIFQDPISSLNPRRKVADIVEEPLKIWKRGDADQRRKRVNDLLEQVGIDPEIAGQRWPHEFSGGQCQRIAIARALALGPEMIICDEPVSALDVSVQAQVLNLLEELKEHYGLTLIFISHDLAVVKNISDRVAVMYLGRIAEIAPAQDLYDKSAHPYSLGLFEAVPEHDPIAARERPAREGLKGELPSPLNPPSGCRFRTRCPRAQELCAVEQPELREIGPHHQVACHFPLTDADRERARTQGLAGIALPNPDSEHLSPIGKE